MEGGNADQGTDMQPEIPALEGPGPEPHPTSADDGEGNGPFSGSMCGSPCEDQRRPLALCSMGPRDLQDGGGDQAGHEARCHAEKSAGAGGQHRLPGCPAGVQGPSQPGHLQGATEPGASLADADELASRGDLSDPTQHVGPECLEPVGSQH